MSDETREMEMIYYPKLPKTALRRKFSSPEDLKLITGI